MFFGIGDEEMVHFVYVLSTLVIVDLTSRSRSTKKFCFWFAKRTGGILDVQYKMFRFIVTDLWSSILGTPIIR